MWTVLRACLGLACFSRVVLAVDLYVTPTGNSTGDGSSAAPLDLATALSTPLAQPGDTIWLRGGVYRGSFMSTLRGTGTQPITVRQYPGERATLDGGLNQIDGGWVNFWGFEVMNSNPNRVSAEEGSAPTDLPIQDAINCTAPGVKFINLVVHDALGNGFGLWLQAPDCEVYGCVIYYNGWQGPDRAHGHGLYEQNLDGTKRVTDCVVFSQYGNGLQLYGTSATYLRNIYMTGNVFFNNGIIAANNSGGGNVIINGPASAGGLRFIGNASYHRDKSAASVYAGWSQENADLTVQDNYLVGQFTVQNWHNLTASGNYFGSDSPLLLLIQDREIYSGTNYSWDYNQYQTEVDWYPFKLQTAVEAPLLFFPDWQTVSGLDAHSTYISGPFTGTRVFLQPNRYEPGRANITVFNWDQLPFVVVDFGASMATGTVYEVRNAQDFFAAPVRTGIYDGQPVSLPMTGLTTAVPVGQAGPPPPTGPEFNSFVVLPIADGGPAGTTSNLFANPEPIAIPAVGAATPYPAAITVSGMAGRVAKLAVSVVDLSHDWAGDLRLLLVSPTGQSAVLMAASGGGSGVINATVTLDDLAPERLPNGTPLGSGTFRPASYGTVTQFPSPAPPGFYGASLSVFAGVPPNGVWSLYVLDANPGDAGNIATGWRLQLWTENLTSQGFSSDTPVLIPSVGAGIPYPSTMAVDGVTGNVVRVTASINNLTHSWVGDLEFLLVGPGGQTLQLMGSAGSGGMSNGTLIFSDSAARLLSIAGEITSGAYQATVNSPSRGFPLPAPDGPYGTTFSAFNGFSPNGAWSLFVQDTTLADAGLIAGGWTLNFQTSTNPVTQAALDPPGAVGQTNQLFLGYLGGPLQTEPRIRLMASGRGNGGSLMVQLKVAPPSPVVLEQSTNSVDWEPIHTNLVESRYLEWTDSTPLNENSRLYRARVFH